MKLFIIEDNAIQAMALEMMARKMGFKNIKKALNGDSAIQQLKNYRPDVMLVDIHLESEITGIDVVKEVQKEQQPAVIYVTGNSNGHYKQMALETDYVDFIVKPVDFKKLERLLRGLKTTINTL